MRIPYKATISYIAFILFVNVAFSYMPYISAFGQSLSPMDLLVGFIYLLRDFAQREIKHRIFIAMIVGCILSYIFADKVIAWASASAFIVAETVDWSIFTFTKKPLSKRLLWSASLSSPLDSVVFLGVAHRLDWIPFLVMTAGKLAGVLLLWASWKARAPKESAVTPSEQSPWFQSE